MKNLPEAELQKVVDQFTSLTLSVFVKSPPKKIEESWRKLDQIMDVVQLEGGATKDTLNTMLSLVRELGEALVDQDELPVYYTNFIDLDEALDELKDVVDALPEELKSSPETPDAIKSPVADFTLTPEEIIDGWVYHDGSGMPVDPTVRVHTITILERYDNFHYTAHNFQDSYGDMWVWKAEDLKGRNILAYRILDSADAKAKAITPPEHAGERLLRPEEIADGWRYHTGAGMPGPKTTRVFAKSHDFSWERTEHTIAAYVGGRDSNRWIASKDNAFLPRQSVYAYKVIEGKTWLTVEQELDGWVLHDGKSFPKEPTTKVHIMLGDGQTSESISLAARHYTWTWKDVFPTGGEIVAYKIVV